MKFPNIFRRSAAPVSTVGEVPTGGPELAFPTLNRDSEIAPGDRLDRGNPKVAPQEDLADVDMLLGRFRDAASARRPVEREWVMACAMTEGRQWLRWDDATHRAESLMMKGKEHRYVTDPLIIPLVAKLTALATMTKPDKSFVPQINNAKGKAAAAEGRLADAHVSRENGGYLQTLDVATWAAVCGVGYDKGYWDPTRRAAIPVYGPDGQVEGKQALPIGDVCRDVTTPFEVYVDPTARRWKDARWLIHASVRPLSYIQERFGEAASDVEPGLAGDGTWADTYVSDGFGGVSQLRENFAGESRSKQVLVLELWEKPSIRYPQGRLLVVAGRKLLYRGKWPTASEEFPFARMVYAEALGHPYGKGLVKDLCPLQVAYNRLLTKVWCRIEDEKPTALIEAASAIGPDAFETNEEHGIRKILYDPSTQPPVWMPPAPQTEDPYKLREIVWQDMQHIAGIHDVNMGSTPGGVTAGVSIELLQQGDRTQLGLFTQSIEGFAVQVGNQNVSLYAENASANLPRMMGLDDSGDPQTAELQAVSFRALTGGGAVNIVVLPGSATPKTPAGQKQEILDFLRLGLLPEGPDAALIAIKLLSLTGSDAALSHLERMIEQAKGAQPNPAQIEELKAQAARKAQQIQLQGAAEQMAITTHAQGQLAEQRHRHEMEKLQFQFTNPKLSGSMDPAAVVDLEAKLGIRGEVPTPPKPAAPSSPNFRKKETA
ncbi:MAG: hypothetical protein V4671_15885 [Armatimonadota bacterium]